MEKPDITIGIVGSGGDGVVAAGDILSNSAAHKGLHCMMMKSFGPQIRGGESSCRLRVSSNKIHSRGSGLNVLVCFSWDDFAKFGGEFEVEDDVIILDDEEDKNDLSELLIKGGKKRRLFHIPFAKLAREINNPNGKNMVMLGVMAELFGLSMEGLEVSIRKRFESKKPEVLKANLEALKVGEDYVRENLKNKSFKFVYKTEKPSLLLTGNEAVAFGSLVSGCRFFSSYPITPASEIMEWMGVLLPKFDGVMVQAEDEISAICMVTGASYGGVKAMTATSGPGLSLKMEAIGLGIMAELPYVVVNVQRGGPSTGMPTKPEQSDLLSSIFGMHGDAPHAVIAAADVEDCFRSAIEAFNVTEQYQMPVILLSDQNLAHRKETVRELEFEDLPIKFRVKPRGLSKGSFKRFTDTPDGISPVTWPGIKNGEYLCSGIEHDEWGAPTSKYAVHEKMCAKRAKKLAKLAKEYKFIRRYGEESPEVGVITWGSNKGVVREAVDYFAAKGDSVGAIVPQLIYPLQKEIFRSFISSVKTLIIVENSYDGQFLQYLKSQLRLPEPENILHLKAAGGRSFMVRDVMSEIDKALGEM